MTAKELCAELYMLCDKILHDYAAAVYSPTATDEQTLKAHHDKLFALARECETTFQTPLAEIMRELEVVLGTRVKRDK